MLITSFALCLSSCGFVGIGVGGGESDSELSGSRTESNTEGHSNTEPPAETTDATQPDADTAEQESSATDTAEPETETELETERETYVPDYDTRGVLSYEHLGELSGGRNVVFFLIDRFDVRYFESLQKKEPEFLEELGGFTYYNDYLSLYCRTYPAITSILTGKENDFEDTRLNYFKEAYTSRGHLHNMFFAGYDVTVYTEKYYAYDNAAYMRPYVKNVATTGQYTEDMKTLHEHLTQNDFELTDSYGQFTFIHLYGCHTPVKYNLDWEEATDKEKNDTTLALKQSLTIIYEYMEQMKKLGVYEDATIIITGDHPAAISDTKLIGEASKSDNGTRVTAMLFKRSGETGDELKINSAQISQDELWHTIYESEGLDSLKTGESFFDIPEGEERTRRYLFERSVKLEDGKTRADEIVEYRITGSGRNRENWQIYKTTVVGRIYK